MISRARGRRLRGWMCDACSGGTRCGSSCCVLWNGAQAIATQRAHNMTSTNATPPPLEPRTTSMPPKIWSRTSRSPCASCQWSCRRLKASSPSLLGWLTMQVSQPQRHVSCTVAQQSRVTQARSSSCDTKACASAHCPPSLVQSSPSPTPRAAGARTLSRIYTAAAFLHNCYVFSLRESRSPTLVMPRANYDEGFGLVTMAAAWEDCVVRCVCA